VDRRPFLLTSLAGVLAAPLAAEGQPEKVHRIGVLAGGSPPSHRGPLTDALRELGYVEGRNLVIEGRYAEGRPERLPGLAAELVRLRVDVLVTFATPATMAAKAATATIPIVMTDVGDPVAGGLVATLARPGGNVTGLAVVGSEIGRRALEMLKEAVPPIARASVVKDPMNPAYVRGYADMEAVATRLGITLGSIDGRSGADLDRAFAVALRDQPEGLLVLPLHATLRGPAKDGRLRGTEAITNGRGRSQVCGSGAPHRVLPGNGRSLSTSECLYRQGVTRYLAG
jgi:ABC-type uncharacterized transport system substrate-binding protein